MLDKAANARLLNTRITDYLAELFASGNMTEDQVNETAGVMYVLSDIDRIGSLCRDLATEVQERIGKKSQYSDDAMKDLKKSLTLIEGMYSDALNMMTTGNMDNAKTIIKNKEKVTGLDINMRKAHMKRVGKGKCEAGLTASFSKILHLIDRMGNTCANIADAALGEVDFAYFINIVENEKQEVKKA
ncbi:MAG: hypothetical protein EOM18_10505 [Clostridia bacterium]|nr:hypothetical protein [Clostridia bacterium]